MNEIEALNRTLFLHINGGNYTPAWLVQASIGMADYLIDLIPLLLLGLWLQGDYARRNLAIKSCLIALLGVAANQIVGVVWPHPRPFMIGLGHAWIQHAADPSFPSDHMTVFAGVGLTLLLDGAGEWGIATMLTGLCVAWARVFLGVHFPLDMVGAVGVAACTYSIVSPLWRVLGASITSMTERLYRYLLARPIAMGWIRN
ncbi:undecaprenyl diphosphate phosphatase, putative [Citrifermentans bemidjiense Bem]|uniref:Undecaprenyl diphosphate phosphatase, putative n=1 Tax=Citrifermentans bemidjiense (strain ATCC BAA-1014 / DSM 16622 / JCM 12645 / Bem) TaxID=404380 RepID=B5EDG8_CITBB|nr:phosphatase PAP2 family protein [Citrifermentans bemidjiense]ACH39164.1 undecaprenyl diphosphate phosphatase, putative [Citrifermentans bemidjiense Bem]